uniref:Uncharacterized protein n=1 Tax=Nelumbo nucifera TaxID=4432 RepID=A0A822XRJ6_NELNU|nr:TPA_asm: hypothetical protein HUJ06_023756 [Nelumbo nucifera]
MEPPSRLLGRSTIPTVFHVAIIICWALLQPKPKSITNQSRLKIHYKQLQILMQFIQTFMVELDSIERMLIQIELTVIAGDQESYRISVSNKGESAINHTNF